MSLFVDQQYVNTIASRFRNFKRKGDNLWNFSCPVCGDSENNATKARGYIFRIKGSLVYKCHNCQYSASLGHLIKKLDPVLHKQYILDMYKDGKVGHRKLEPPPKNSKMKNFGKPKTPDNLLDKLLDRVDTLPKNHEAVKYLNSRMIPKNKFNRIYFIDNVKNIVQLKSSYRDKIITDEPRIILPFYDEYRNLIGVTCRAIRDEKLRYIIIRIKDDIPMIFGMDHIDNTKNVVIVEGPLDSLFLENSIAVGGSDFNKLVKFLDKDKNTIVYDNQPRNKSVCSLLKNVIDAGYKVCIWPENIKEKDINDMILAGIDVSDVIHINTFQGPAAALKFNQWKRS